MWKKKEEKKEEVKEVDLLEELCGGDAKLHDFLSSYLFVDPLAAISPKSLDSLTEEGQKSGDFRPAVDKAIFEGAQKPGERAKYIKIIQNLALKTMHAIEQEKEKATKERLTDRAALLEKRIEKQKFMSERTEDILSVASKFYKERLVELGESERREERKENREKAEAEEWRKAEIEKARQEERKQERKGMGREERKEAEKQDKKGEPTAEERKEARGEARGEAEREEQKIEEIEKAGQEARKKERGGN
jgi:hypothetical protein